MPGLFTAHRVRALPARTHFQINLHGVTGQESRMSELFAAHRERAVPANIHLRIMGTPLPGRNPG